MLWLFASLEGAGALEPLCFLDSGFGATGFVNLHLQALRRVTGLWDWIHFDVGNAESALY